MSSGRLSALLQRPFWQFRPPNARGNERQSWPEAIGTVADCVRLPSPEDKKGAGAVIYSIRFTYWVERRMHSGCFKTETQYAPGDAIAVRYDPRHPERNSADPEEKLRTGLLVVAAIVLAGLYFVLAMHS